MTRVKSDIATNTSRLFLAIALFAAGNAGLSTRAMAEVDHPWVTPQISAPKLKAGRYCTSGATAQVQINKQYTSINISGRGPDQRGVSGKQTAGFSGEGFSLQPVSNKKIRVVQYQYNLDRTFNRC